jgi:predicted acetylornithine/succinylornithine family transaminase
MEQMDSYVMKTYARIPVALVRGQGTRVWDADGREYLDFMTGLAVCSLGHCHPKVVEAIREQAGRLLHVSNLFYMEPQGTLARLLVENSCFDRVFFCNSGAEANEAAIKLARKYSKQKYGPGRYEIITTERSFHGRTLATLTATGQTKYQKGFEPLPEGFTYVPYNDLDAVAARISDRTCAVMIEPVQGEAGVYPASPEYMTGLSQLLRDRGVLLILDEVQTGFGRTGQLFAYQHFAGVTPDIMSVAKALGGGVAIGAMLATSEVSSGFEPGNHASTFGGNPLACAAGIAAFTAIIEENLPERARVMGDYFQAKLRSLMGAGSHIADVRGLGLMIAVELSVDATEVARRARENGLLVNVIAGKILRLLPPLTVTEDELDQAVAVIAKAVQETAA